MGNAADCLGTRLKDTFHRLGTVLREQQKERQRHKRGPYKKVA